MKIHFFEEFPNNRNLLKAKLIKGPCIIFLASNSYQDFLNNKLSLKKINPSLEAAYWPVLKASYWVSPFSTSTDLKNLYSELSRIKTKTKVLIDLELPLIHPNLFFKNFTSLRKNKKIILDILRLNGNVEIFTAEYPPLKLISQIMKWLGLTNKGENKIPMCYTSMLPVPLRSALRNVRSDWVGVGTIAKGILKIEPILSPEELDKNLGNFKKLGTKNVVIFRLGGLNKEYIRVINKYNENSRN